MRHRRLFYTRAAKARLHSLPAQVQLQLETHLENLSLLAERLPPERLPLFLTREEEGFATTAQGVRVHFAVTTATHALLIHRIDAEPREERAALEPSAVDSGP
ncbi:MAG: hypothetical protein ACJ8AT_10745 [Hyalangium sp.]|uniref:hypothetical protein n=1 Tax=Hyalangium sp. TaxID=2028555 RepID=UPI00389B1C52